jgi:hypothetical protein
MTSFLSLTGIKVHTHTSHSHSVKVGLHLVTVMSPLTSLFSCRINTTFLNRSVSDVVTTRWRMQHSTRWRMWRMLTYACDGASHRAPWRVEVVFCSFTYPPISWLFVEMYILITHTLDCLLIFSSLKSSLLALSSFFCSFVLSKSYFLDRLRQLYITVSLRRSVEMYISIICVTRKKKCRHV